jgi:uncharacterized protein (DUF2141 family)
MNRLLILIASMCVTGPAVAQQPRDRVRGFTEGSARVAGFVVSDESRPKPVRRVRVTLDGTDLGFRRTVITNDDGVFAIERLPPGRYTLTAAKDGYVTANYGAKRPGRAGRTIALLDRETRTVTLRITRGSVISGTITDEGGEPASGVPIGVYVSRMNAATGEGRFVPAAQATLTTTNDRGEYRLFGLPAGDYLVRAEARMPVTLTTFASDLQVLSAAEIRRALAEAREPGPQARPGPPTKGPAPIVSNELRQNVTLAPVFYPGTADISRAMIVTVGPAEERTGIDFDLQIVSAANVSGVVSFAGRTPPSITLIRRDTVTTDDIVTGKATDLDGSFAFRSVMPGKYTLIARANPQMRVQEYASTDIVVHGDDITGIGLTLQPMLTIAGRITFEGTRTRSARLSWDPVVLPLQSTSAPVGFPAPGVQVDSGRFIVSGLVPGSYRITRPIPGLHSDVDGWWLKSIIVSQREVLDAPLELHQSTGEAVVAFSDQASELAGRVTDIDGTGSSDVHVVIFSTDKNYWFPNSRRVTGVLVDANGRYHVRNLPPGDYLVAASSDVEPGEWFDPAILQRLVGGGRRITIGEDERKTVDVPARPD